MKRLLILSILVISGCQSVQIHGENRPPVSFSTRISRDLPSGCLIQSLEFQNSLIADSVFKKSSQWSRVLLFDCIDKSAGVMGRHAVCVFQAGRGYWVYDPQAVGGGSQFLGASLPAPMDICRKMERYLTAKALWIEDAK